MINPFFGSWNWLKGLWAGGDPNDERYWPINDANDYFLALNQVAAAGIRVTPQVAMRFSAVFACVRVIAQTIQMLPWHLHRRDGNQRIDAFDHPVELFLSDQPNDEIDSGTFRETACIHALTWGNGYAEIEQDLRGRPLALWLLEPWRVTPKRDEQKRLYYEVRDEQSGETRDLEPSQIWHLKGMSLGDGTVGMSPVRYAQESIGLGIAAEKFGGSFFGNGGHVAGVLKHPKALSEGAQTRLRDNWRNLFGGVEKAHKIAVLEEGMDFEKISIPPNEAQFIATREFQVTDICRWYGVPPHMVADLTRATFSNIENQSREFVNSAIQPWTRRFERETKRKLLTRQERLDGYYTLFNLNALLRADTARRANFYKMMFNTGAFSPNDILRMEDLNPIEGGDLHMLPLNMVSLEEANRTGNTKRENQRESGDTNNASILLGDGRPHVNGSNSRL
jgi:HK97 family phage portal protein